MDNNDNNKSSSRSAGIKISSYSSRTSISCIMLIYFVSGACSLIYEVIWVRLLKLTLGNTVYASTIVVSMFMAGLALGAFIMGRYSDGIRNRLKLYALLETLITITAVLSPFALRLADSFYVWFYRSFHPGNTQLILFQVLISAGIVLVPSLLMGSTLPLLSRFVTSIEERTGRLVGKLYALNTFGAATGCFLAGFVLIRAFGVMNSLYIAAVMNLLVALGGWALSGLSPGKNEIPVRKKVNHKHITVAAGESQKKFYILVAAFFTSGLISIGYELLWMRSIIHLMYGFTYVFSAVLTVYLLGNVIGAGIGSGLVSSLKKPMLGFAVTLFILGVCGLVYLPVLILWSSKIMARVDTEIELLSRTIPYSVFMVKPLVQSLFLFLFPSLMMGIGFPIALQAWTNHVHRIGRSTGTAYAANTIGAVVGGIVTGFVLIPLLGLQTSITVLGLLGVWIATVICVLFVGSSNKLGRYTLLVAAGILTVASFLSPSNLFEVVVMNNPRIKKPLEMLETKEGITTTVSILRDPDEDALFLYTSGEGVAGDTFFLRSDQEMLGHFGVLLNKNAKKVLSVGFGSGESTACLALYNLERADCVEIAPELVDLSVRFFNHINLGNKLNEHINMIYMDAKNYIHLTDIKYDTIVNDSIHPRIFAENASLYAKEYYQSAKEHLEPGGLFLSWIPSHNYETASVLESIIGTMMDVFPHVTLWYMTPSPASYYVVIGSEQPQYFSPEYIEKELAKEGILESLSLTNINNCRDIMTCYIGDKDDLKRCIKNYAVNSDYTPYIEFETDFQAAGNHAFKEFIHQVRSDSVYSHIDWTGYSLQQKQQWLSDFEILYEASSYLLLTNSTNQNFEKIEYCMAGLSILPDNPGLLDVRERAEQKIFSTCEMLFDANQNETALAQSDRILEMNRQSVAGWIIRSKAMQKTGRIQQAIEAAEIALELNSNNTDAHKQMGDIFLSEGQINNALEEYQTALKLGQESSHFITNKHIQILNALAKAYILNNQVDEATASLEKAIALANAKGRKEKVKEINEQLQSLINNTN